MQCVHAHARCFCLAVVRRRNVEKHHRGHGPRFTGHHDKRWRFTRSAYTRRWHPYPARRQCCTRRGDAVPRVRSGFAATDGRSSAQSLSQTVYAGRSAVDAREHLLAPSGRQRCGIVEWQTSLGTDMPPAKLRIGFATPEYVTENHFDGGLANYLNRISKTLVELGHDVHVVTLSQQDEAEFEHDGVMVHRVTLGRGWQAFNRLTRYSLPTTLHWLNFSAQVFRKLKQLHRREPFDVIQYPNYSSCGLLAIPFLRTTHVVRTSSYDPDCNDLSGVKRNLDITIAERLEALQYRLTRNVHVPSFTTQKMLSAKVGVRNTCVIRSPFYVETPDWDTTIWERFLKDKEYLLYFGRFQLHKGFH